MDRKEWKLRRISKDITLTEIANSIYCSVSLLSKFENDKADMKQKKIEQYKEYIINKGVV
ncbi:helix-turn-helix domain-containing protein [Sporanaerobacter acetigenes]|uniref:Helix-turn-helix n=1 Tax=Sporanaerobacter acetigenes DSM 13106 TaxID=1123281 RepID=A0A1M5RZG3_9FIRM|nr:helix-turn-helix transcriptional regulator [Sporanaerobacter acetigenes]SHH31605.1 hypothetical protein SAMN02745180_00026 [Sporanaerobacter acetigenes DSM 13106]